MCPTHKMIWLFFTLGYFRVIYAQYFLDENTTPVHLTKGAVLIKIENTIMYTDTQSILQPIPDIPDSMVPLAERYIKDRPFLRENAQINSDSFKMLKTLNKMLTYDGLGANRNERIVFEDDMFEPHVDKTNENVKSESPLVLQDGLINATTYTDFQQILNGRRMERKMAMAKKGRKRRGIPAIIPMLVKLAPKAYKSSQLLWKFGRKLFQKPGELLNNVLTKTVLENPNWNPASILHSKTSEFVVETWKQLDNITKEEGQLRTDYEKYVDSEAAVMKEWKQNPNRYVKHLYDFLILSQLITADQGNLIFTSIIYNMHLLGLMECRQGHIPIQFLPRSLLIEKLKSAISPNMTVAIDIEDIDLFYKLKPAECAYDSDGGIMTINVPMKPKNSELSLHKVQPLQFSYSGKTCQIGIPEMYVAYDSSTSSIQPLTSAESATCLQHEFRKCQVPKRRRTISFGNNMCLQSLLKQTAAIDIIKACPLQCSDIQNTEAIPISSNSYMIANFPESGTVQCDNGYRNEIRHNISVGVLKFTLNCFCRLIVNGMTVVEPFQHSCVQQPEEVAISYYLPIHFSTTSEMLSSEGQDYNTRFLHFAAVFKPDESLFTDQSSKNEINQQHILWNFISDAIQYVILIYIIFRVHLAPALLFGLGNNAEAYMLPNYDHSHDCKLPDNIFYLSVSTLIMLCIFVGFKILKALHLALKNIWEKYVDQAAQNQLNVANFES